MGFVFQVEQAQQNPGKVCPVRSCGAEQVGCAAVVIPPVAGSQPRAADAVSCRDAGQHREAGRNVQILVAFLLPKNHVGDFEVRAGGLEPGPGISRGTCGSS